MRTEWLLYGIVALAHLAALAAWMRATRKNHPASRPSVGDILIGVIVNFLDTLGIGSYAQITSLFKLRGRPSDDLIPRHHECWQRNPLLLWRFSLHDFDQD